MSDGGGGRAFLLSLLVVAACSSSSSDSSSGRGGAAGDAGTTSGSGGKGGSSTGGAGTGGSGTSGESGSGASGDAGSGNAGAAGSASGQSGSAGAAGSSSGGMGGSIAGGGGRSGAGGERTSCSRDDDCVVAATYANTGCCSRGCGVALNGDWVEQEPCATADPMTDPVPASCNTGCTPCPQDPRCPTVHDAICLSGTCTAVTDNGPCSANTDCVLAVDYTSQFGACCGCPTVASQATIDHAPCIVPVSEPEPAGCEPSPPDICASTSCPITCNPPMNLRCDAGRCVSG